MKNFYRIAIFCLFLINFSSYSQLNSFLLTVSKTNETCLGNGSISITTQNTTPGATMVFSIYLLPNTVTPISIQSATALGGLNAGTYRVVATQSLGNDTASKQQDVTITNLIVPFSIAVSGQNALCGNDGTITVTATQGVAVSYEVFDGPMTFPLQPSPTFSGLTPGQYQVRAFDSCGEGVVQTYTVASSPVGLSINPLSTLVGDCDIARVRFTFSVAPGTSIAFPLTVQTVVHPPSGPDLIFTQTATSTELFYQNIPLFTQAYSYDVTVTDNCGNQYFSNGNAISLSLNPSTFISNQNCTDANFAVMNVEGLVLISAPPTFPGTLPLDLTGQLSDFNSLTLVDSPLGTYTFLATNLCGVTTTLVVTLNPPVIFQPTAQTFAGCEIGLGALYISGDYQSVQLISAPSNFTEALPMDVSQNIVPTWRFSMGDLPAGDYVFHVVSNCGPEYDVAASVPGYQESSDISIIPNCGSFDIDLAHESNSWPAVVTFWLQKYDPVTDTWRHPQTNVVYPNNYPTAINSIQLTNNAINYNFAFTGHFRVLKVYRSYESGGENAIYCYRTLHEFDYTGLPKINGIYSFPCGIAFDAIVDAEGTLPLIYRIVEKDGSPFLLENANSAVFTNLEIATYVFQVEDDCGNILNHVFDLADPIQLAITPIDLCDGQPGALTLPNFNFLQYSWWKGNEVGTILSTTNSLDFASFNAASDGGIYHVQILYPNPNSCVNQTLTYEILPGGQIPQAGDDDQFSFCGPQGMMNLALLLPQPHDENGAWTELTSSGALAGNQWNSAIVSPGTYEFKYRVEGLCGTFDEAFLTISIRQRPETPVASLEQIPCEGQTIYLSSTTIANVSYHWSGPNGFESDDQNPVIENATSANNGIYTLTVSNEFCTSEATIEVSMNPTANFTIEQACIDGVYTLTAIPDLPAGSNQDDFEYSWSGPENFSASGNPVAITGMPSGTYAVNATFENNCPLTKTVGVAFTLCDIPKGVSPDDNGDNDTFDLSGFDVEFVKIFNRYGMTVYEMAGYVDQWHGQDYDGNLLPSATYYYQVQLQTGETKTGWVYLQRK